MSEIPKAPLPGQIQRELGEILKRMAQSGERRGPGDPDTSRGATPLDGLGIPRDRASRAMQLAEVPQEQFDAALAAHLDNSLRMAKEFSQNLNRNVMANVPTL